MVREFNYCTLILPLLRSYNALKTLYFDMWMKDLGLVILKTFKKKKKSENYVSYLHEKVSHYY